MGRLESFKIRSILQINCREITAHLQDLTKTSRMHFAASAEWYSPASDQVINTHMHVLSPAQH